MTRIITIPFVVLFWIIVLIFGFIINLIWLSFISSFFLLLFVCKIWYQKIRLKYTWKKIFWGWDEQSKNIYGRVALFGRDYEAKHFAMKVTDDPSLYRIKMIENKWVLYGNSDFLHQMINKEKDIINGSGAIFMKMPQIESIDDIETMESEGSIVVERSLKGR